MKLFVDFGCAVVKTLDRKIEIQLLHSFMSHDAFTIVRRFSTNTAPDTARNTAVVSIRFC